MQDFFSLLSKLRPKGPIQWRKIGRYFIWLCAAMAFTYILVIVAKYRQLESAFLNQDQFTPTRIFSDVTIIKPGQPKSYVLERLKSLKYQPAGFNHSLIITVRARNYPSSLLPVGYPADRYEGSTVQLSFEEIDEDPALFSIRVGEEELPELILEPELVATLNRGEAGEEDQIRDLIRFENFPAQIWKAIIAVEDQHYLDHKGLDPRGIARAILVNLKTFSFAQGGSTITQQLVKNLMARRTKNIFKKANEILLSVLLELRFDKEKILERYLNEVYLGQIGNLEIHGVAEGAKYFFGKDITQLNLGEIAMIAGIINGPWYFSPYRHFDRAIDRQRFVLKKMVETGQIAQEEAEIAEAHAIRLVPPPSAGNKAPYFTDYVKSELINYLEGQLSREEISRAGFQVYTTLDLPTNRIAQNAVEKEVEKVTKRLKVDPSIRLEGALAAVDHSKGAVRALVGGRSYRDSTFNRILNMKRQVGSTIKPAVYLTAFEKEVDYDGTPYGGGYPLYDEKWTLIFDKGRQRWSPRNYERDYRGWITMRESLSHSVNVTAAKLGMTVGLDDIASTIRRLGITSEIPHFPSLVLGAVELHPLELLTMYSTIANRGFHDELNIIRAITTYEGDLYADFEFKPVRVFAPQKIDLLRNIMESVFDNGTASFSRMWGFERPAAGKTGTTSDHRDSWFAGFTPQLTAVAWVGIDKTPELSDIRDPAEEKAPKEEVPSPVRLTGANAALHVWTAFMKGALVHEPELPFEESEYLTQVRIDKKSGKKATSNCPDEQVVIETYINDLVPTEETCATDWPDAPSETAIE